VKLPSTRLMAARKHLAPCRVALVLVLAALTIASSASAASTVDQQQLVIGTNGWVIGGGSAQKIAQVVTPAIAGFLTEVRATVGCNDGAVLTVEIQDVSPGGPVLASSTFPGSSFPPFSADPQFRAFALATPPFIPAGAPFAFVLSATGNCGINAGPVGDPYPGGNEYFWAVENSRWLCFCSVVGQPNDLAFQTYVNPACQVPSVVGETRSDAEAEITHYGCQVGTVTTRFSSSPVDDVLEQSPPAGTQLASGTAVSLVVSAGPEPCIVPNVLRKTLIRARAAIVQSRCGVGRVTRAYSKRKKGIVIGQRPTAGTELAAGTRVNLVISRGPKPKRGRGHDR